MFKKMIVLCFCCAAFHANAETESPIFFMDVDSAKKWFSEAYPKYDLVQDKKYPGFFSFYGVKGSGILRVDGWFYSCQESGKLCGLIGMADFGELRGFKPAEIGFNKSHLTIKTDKVQLRFNVQDKK